MLSYLRTTSHKKFYPAGHSQEVGPSPRRSRVNCRAIPGYEVAVASIVKRQVRNTWFIS